ncbi:HEAT repeat domain-containing protein [Paenibacillus sp. HJGM_3]|uniref:HEAT repeat domain-containing protein n=1 Tax=Paenibacillus sp. HJGM_3 TaxID=3379816 RepID=UPI00385890BE
MAQELRYLTDEQMRQFIAQGFLILNTDFSPAFHEQLYGKLSEVYKNEGNPGNNLYPRIRELQTVFDHPVIKGALTSVLGPGYMMHAHRHGHYNNSPKPGGWHKDSYWGFKRMRNHRPWWAMVMYFPQNTPTELGPTGVMPGTHYYASRTFESDDLHEETAAGPAGTFALIHYDIWHRSTANISGQERFMLKFEFMRTQAPVEASWDHREPEWVTPANLPACVESAEVIWRDTWNWLTGRDALRDEAPRPFTDDEARAWLAALASGEPQARTEAADRLALSGLAEGRSAYGDVVTALAHALEDAHEPAALNAAYGLARLGGAQATAALLGALQQGSRPASRAAAYGLTAAGGAAVEGLLAALDSGPEDVAAQAAFALGELREAAAEAVPALARLLRTHASPRVRTEAVDALGRIGTGNGSRADACAEALAGALQDADDQVRFMAGLALSMLGAAGEPAVPALESALDDENRYVRAHAAEALYYIGTERAKEALFDFLRTSRWCPSTTPASTF